MNNRKELERLISGVEKSFKQKRLLYRLGDGAMINEEERFASGITTLDVALYGGIPRGRTVEIFGPEGSGKTTLALCFVAEVQRGGGTAAFIDMEHALDPIWADRLGVNVDDLLFSQPDTGEQALELVDNLVDPSSLGKGVKGVDMIIVDSVASLIPEAELKGKTGDSHVALQARLMSHHMRKITGKISKSRCLVITSIKLG